jgi:hypothetical protein
VVRADPILGSWKFNSLHQWCSCVDTIFVKNLLIDWDFDAFYCHLVQVEDVGEGIVTEKI